MNTAQLSATTSRNHAIDIAAVPAGAHVLVEIKTGPMLTVKRRALAAGAFEHCQAIMVDQALKIGRKAAVVQKVSDREWYAIDDKNNSTTLEVMVKRGKRA